MRSRPAGKRFCNSVAMARRRAARRSVAFESASSLILRSNIGDLRKARNVAVRPLSLDGRSVSLCAARTRSHGEERTSIRRAVLEAAKPWRTTGSRQATTASPFSRRSSRGPAHSVEAGARRIVRALVDRSLDSGVFYGSKADTLTGPFVDQSEIFPDLSNPAIQDNANEAVHRFIA
jgi:hypothetical protein